MAAHVDLSSIAPWLIAIIAMVGALWLYINGHSTQANIYIEVGELRRQVENQQRIIEEQRQRIALLEQQLDELRRLYQESLQRENAATAQLLDMQRQLQAMRQNGHGGKNWLNVLAICPDSDLDMVSVRNALYDAGIPYRALVGTVRKDDIVRALEEGSYTVLEVDAHGRSDGIELSDGLARPGWWASVIGQSGKRIRLAVFMACDSLDVARAVKRAGVRWVVAVRGQIQDEDAVRFLVHFYEALANGYAVRDAIRRGESLIGLDAADAVTLLE
jgi:hypothetical protein